ncbi:programmed cell death 6-interacting protein [Neodiprion virginianus]|uniref:Programmed cell death 6-interacting protein n=1 Tax=Neodiprion lecontei TaxID=441921 RepID=A0A6J0BKU9_NEOLC|nr:programmed cell death 6-interacting protein [Neodiprion lecontei]XP_046435913.1 programmed cell death 6-interacting protein [Neodiprion fabricii]XP_046629794.1 programmed cell death 6-interacting protein [Neodiprion virginianus]
MADLIAVPLKKPSDVDIVKPLTNVIKSTYNSADNQKDYTESINEFNKLRNNALWRAFEKYESSLEVIYSYYDQLNALEAKIPAHELQIPFKWKDAFDRTIFGGKLSLTISSLAYEKVCVLFNIAALQSAVGATQSLDSDEGLKLAAKLFQQSAGIFNYLKGNVMLAIQQEPTPDISPDTLGALSSLMLAQAQEIFVHKAIHDSMKDGIIAKLAAQAEDLYAEALKLFQKEIFRAFWDKEWVPLIAGKQAGYRAMAELYQSFVCKTNKSIGEEIARLEHAVELFKSAQQRSNKPNLFQDYANKAQRNLTEAKKDNDFIYHERIPDVKMLNPIGKASVAKILPPSETFSSNFHDLFAELLPVSVHHALSSYESRRNEVVNSEISKLRESTQMLNSVLASLNLPAAIEDTSGTELPQSLLDKAAYVRNAGGVQAIEATMNELPELLQRNKDILDESERMLKEEKDSDDQLREQFKERWTRIPSASLTEQFTVNARKYREIINNAVTADKVVRQRFESFRSGMETLSKDPSELLNTVPAGSALQESGAVSQLRKLMEDVETLKAERDAIESELKSAATDMKSVFLSALSQDGAIDEPNMSVEHIGQVYGPLQKQVRDSLARQESLVADIQARHAAFINEHSGAGSTREAMLCQLASAYDAFKELENNLREGAKFYNDLTQLLVVFQNKISDFCFARKTEKEELMKDLTTNLSHTGPATTPTIPSHHGGNTPQSQSQSNIQGGSQLPYPTMQYQGGMPVPYGASAATPYPTYVPPPMPAGYNGLYNYATMPYPTQGGYNPYQPQPHAPQAPYGGYATLPRYGGSNPPPKPW